MNEPCSSQSNLTPPVPHPRSRGRSCRVGAFGLALTALLAISACGGGSGGTPATNPDGSTLAGSGNEPPAQPSVANRPSQQDAARMLIQATFGATSVEDIEALRVEGFERWLWNQFNTPAMSHTGYLDAQRTRNDKSRATDEMSYEAVWQQWLTGPDQLRARVSFALGQIVVISNVAPDLRPYAMSSYLDMLNRNAFGNYRTLLKDVTLHPAMGYYLNMMKSEKDDPAQGIHPNENYAREVLQLFSIGLVELNPDGSAKLGGEGKPIPTYGEAEVKGFAKAFSGWTFASQDPAKPSQFHKGDESLDSNWTTPMRAFASKHAPDAKKLLGSTTLPAGQTPEKDLEDAIDVVFNHPNVGPFIGRQLIQRLVTSNPSRAYIARVTAAFNNNGAGVRGDLKAVVQATLLDPEARAPTAGASYGKQREPVIRFANYLRALGARSSSGINAIHYLDSTDDGLGQSPLLAPSVFNFFSPNFRQPGAVARAGLYAPEFQITTETSVVGSLNFFASLIHNGGYGWGDHRMVLNTEPLEALASDPGALVARIDALFFGYQMGSSTRERLTRMLVAMPGGGDYQRKERVQAALIVTAMSPDYVVQK